ncbi:NCS1 nucleoside transporter family protein [Roseobacter sp. SK209-2-6]|uniref:NCS1 family nucleobase:cation symporter-1 n=1 Tax=Roseobacter sp. SK209-2-6 TaxID=388739 RepID=UPI0000F3D901|nr:NCS1 family nucleobase:cation symporter-1 [Roseobacter sp. SK209-2-6]EBA17478.1 NCS1 nucleoside transporter family protein [Roseobacter sp. SK209-2-6]
MTIAWTGFLNAMPYVPSDRQMDPSLYNEDLAPVPADKRDWGWFELFNVWANDVQSLFGYTLAASLFLAYGLNGWAVFAGIVLAGFIVMGLVNLIGKPSVQYGIPFPVMARASMGVRGANFPAVIRAVVAIFWYGVQTYFASTALALAIVALTGASTDPVFLGLALVDWVAFLFVWGFQIALFWNGIDLIVGFLNFAGPFVYAVMLTLAVVIWIEAGNDLWSEVGTIFRGTGGYEGSQLGAFAAVVGTMIAYFSAVVINFGDFSRFVRSEDEMRKGNLLGLPINIAFFSLIALIVTAGTVAIWGEALTNPTEIIARVDSLPLTILASVMFLMATVGINLVANFIPPAYDLANLLPSKINFRVAGIITSAYALVIGGLWVSTISHIGILGFVNTLGAVLAPVYGIMIADYYLVKSGKLEVGQLFSASRDGPYYYSKGWNPAAIVSFILPAGFSILTVWVPMLSALAGFAWVIGAGFGGVFYWAIAKR